MTLESAIEAELPLLRSEALGRMTSRVTIRRLVGLLPQDEETGGQEAEWLVPCTNLPARLAARSSTSRNVTVGGVDYEQATPTLHLPADTSDLLDGDVVQFTAGEWTGSTYRIVDATKGDQRTARRVSVVEIPDVQDEP